MYRSISFLLFLSVFITGCNTSSIEAIATPADSPITATPTLVKTNTPIPTNTPTTTPHPTSTATPIVLPTQTPKPTDIPVTELHLRLKNSKGAVVPFSKAELLMEGWMVATSFPLDFDGNLLVLPLEEDVARGLWLKDFPEHFGHSYFLYLEADGYVPVRSEVIYFIGTRIWEDEPPDEVIIEFHNGPKVSISKGEKQEIELIMREPQERYLRLVDDYQNPVPGVKVRSYMFWSDSNRCRQPQGVNFLAEGISDEEGFVTIPDGEFEYLLEFEKPLYHLSEPVDYNSMRLINYISAQETVVELHELNKRPLELFVQKNGKPQVNSTLFGQGIDCVCGLCNQELATTDNNGRISLNEFYPEEWAFIYFWREAQTGPFFAWQADPKEFTGTEVIEVQLSE